MTRIGLTLADEWHAAGPGHRFARRLGAAMLIVAMLSGATAPCSLEVKVADLRSDKGVLRICVTAQSAHFPDCSRDPHAITRTVPAGEHVIRFDGMAPGSYAVSIIHDANGNAKLDTLMGIPREGFGFSRNPVITFGPPRFSSARFQLNPGASEQTVRMRYFL